MKNKHIILLLFVLMLVSTSFSKRNYKGISKTNSKISSVECKNKELCLFTDGFDSKKLHHNWKKTGNIIFKSADNKLKAPIRSRRHEKIMGQLICTKSFRIDNTVTYYLDVNIPSSNPTLSVSMFITSKKNIQDSKFFPKDYIRFQKRSQLESIDIKNAKSNNKMLWARNEPVKTGENISYKLYADRDSIMFYCDNKLVFSGKNTYNTRSELIVGIWVYSNGDNYGGGSITFDNFILEADIEKFVPQKAKSELLMEKISNEVSNLKEETNTDSEYTEQEVPKNEGSENQEKPQDIDTTEVPQETKAIKQKSNQTEGNE